MQVILSTTLLHLLPLQLGFGCFSALALAKFSLLRSKQAIQCAALINMLCNMQPCIR